MFGILAEGAAGGATKGSGFGLIIYLVVIIGVMYFIMIRPQKKKQKQEQQMRESLQPGDELVTIGGIYGRIISVKDDSIIIESSADHSKLKIAKWAISQNLTVHEAPAEVKPVKKRFGKKKDEE
ncbi:MAG: preprotein translocase subunit YajC [Ruminococcaceae bacterium]|nr:preprotein translocase subunit YajC [Oscillospiraceae bacterium]